MTKVSGADQAAIITAETARAAAKPIEAAAIHDQSTAAQILANQKTVHGVYEVENVPFYVSFDNAASGQKSETGNSQTDMPTGKSG